MKILNIYISSIENWKPSTVKLKLALPSPPSPVGNAGIITSRIKTCHCMQQQIQLNELLISHQNISQRIK